MYHEFEIEQLASKLKKLTHNFLAAMVNDGYQAKEIKDTGNYLASELLSVVPISIKAVSAIKKTMNIYHLACNSAYNPTTKKKFHREAAKILRQLATKLGYNKSDYDLSHNQGGIAVSGEVTLHSDHLYVQLSDGSLNNCFLWRTCNGRKDYCGHENQWMPWYKLEDLDGAARTFQEAICRNQAA